MQRIISWFVLIISLSFSVVVCAVPLILSNKLQQTRVLALLTFLQSPYVIEQQQQKIYVRGLPASLGTSFVVFRRGVSLVDPRNNTDLGIVAHYIATAKLIQTGDPAILQVTTGDSIIRQGDRLFLPINKLKPITFQKTAGKVSAQIIASLKGSNKIAVHHIVVLNYGVNDGALPGQILPIIRMPILPLDQFVHQDTDAAVTYVKLGSLMIVKSFAQTSFAVILTMNKPIHILDHVVAASFWKAYASRH